MGNKNSQHKLTNAQQGNKQEEDRMGKETGDVVHTNIVEILETVRGGNCLFDLSQSMEQLVGLIRKRKKGGSLVLTLEVKPMNAGDPHTLTIIDTVKIKEPAKQKNNASIFFSTQNNTLERNDPRQMSFEEKDESFANAE